MLLQGPWAEVINILSTCDVAFNDEVLVNKKISAPSQRIECIAHMLRDPQVKALLITLSDPALNSAETRPAQLDLHQGTTISRTSAVYNEIFNNYMEWQKNTSIHIAQVIMQLTVEHLNPIKPPSKMQMILKVG
jgi:hypothetical protein